VQGANWGLQWVNTPHPNHAGSRSLGCREGLVAERRSGARLLGRSKRGAGTAWNCSCNQSIGVLCQESKRKEGSKRRVKSEKGGLSKQRLPRPSPEPRLAERSRERCQVPALCLTCCFPPGQQKKENNLLLLLPELLFPFSNLSFFFHFHSAGH